jgi:ureidoacrylate peracid hydrolase
MCVFSHAVAQGGAVGRAGTPGVAFVEPLPRAHEMVVAKPRYSVFAQNDLAAALKQKGIDTLVLCGLTTECCIQSSAWAAFEQDFRVVIATDAVAAYEPELHRAALRSLELSGASLAATAELASAWK